VGEEFGLSHVRVPQSTRRRVAAGGTVSGSLRPATRGDRATAADCIFEPLPVLACEGCGNEFDEQSASEGRDRCKGCRASEEWAEYEAEAEA